MPGYNVSIVTVEVSAIWSVTVKKVKSGGMQWVKGSWNHLESATNYF